MRQKAAEGLLFASDLDCPRYDACWEDAPTSVVFSPNMANVHETMKDAAIHAEGATNMRPPLDLNKSEDRGKVLKPLAGVAMLAFMPSFRHGQSPTRTTIASSRRLARTYLPLAREMSTVSSTLPRRPAAHVTVMTVLTKLGFAPCHLNMLMTGKDHRTEPCLEVVPDMALAEDIFKHLDCRYALRLLHSYIEGHLVHLGAQGWSHFDTPGGLAIRDADGNIVCKVKVVGGVIQWVFRRLSLAKNIQSDVNVKSAGWSGGRGHWQLGLLQGTLRNHIRQGSQQHTPTHSVECMTARKALLESGCRRHQEGIDGIFPSREGSESGGALCGCYRGCPGSGPWQSGLDDYVAGEAAPGRQDLLAADAHGQPGREAHLGTLVFERGGLGAL